MSPAFVIGYSQHRGRPQVDRFLIERCPNPPLDLHSDNYFKNESLIADN